MRKRSAFSLLELSVILAVIGVLIVGIDKTIALIKSSKVASARSLTQNSVVPKISGLIAWFETTKLESFKDSEMSDESQLSAWYDISPNSILNKKNALTRIASLAVVYDFEGINDLPSIRFDSTGIFELESFYQGPLELSTIFVVFKPYSASSSIVSLIDGNGSSGYRMIVFKNDNIGLYSGSLAWTGNAKINANMNYIISAYQNGPSSKIYLNDSENKCGGSTINAGSTKNTEGLVVGGNINGNYKYNGQMSEIIIYDRLLSKQERKNIMEYLSNKYQIQINSK